MRERVRCRTPPAPAPSRPSRAGMQCGARRPTVSSTSPADSHPTKPQKRPSSCCRATGAPCPELPTRRCFRSGPLGRSCSSATPGSGARGSTAPARFAPAEPLGADPAIYPSAARDGTILFISEGGLRLRFPDGRERRLGWPLSYTPPIAGPVLIRNARIIDGTGAPVTPPRDLLVERGRISRIAAGGTLASGSAQVVDARGGFLIPGLIDLHAHEYRPELMRGFAWFGVTTIRDQGVGDRPAGRHRRRRGGGKARRPAGGLRRHPVLHRLGVRPRGRAGRGAGGGSGSRAAGGGAGEGVRLGAHQDAHVPPVGHQRAVHRRGAPPRHAGHRSLRAPAAAGGRRDGRQGARRVLRAAERRPDLRRPGPALPGRGDRRRAHHLVRRRSRSS